MKKHLRKIGVTTLCLFLMFSFLSGFLLSIHTAWAASERQAAPATETTVPQTDSKDAQGASPKDDQGNYIVGNSGEGVVTLSANPEYLKTVPLGDHKKSMISTYAAGWDDGVIYSSDFASPDGTDIITTTTPIEFEMSCIMATMMGRAENTMSRPGLPFVCLPEYPVTAVIT